MAEPSQPPPPATAPNQNVQRLNAAVSGIRDLRREFEGYQKVANQALRVLREENKVLHGELKTMADRLEFLEKLNDIEEEEDEADADRERGEGEEGPESAQGGGDGTGAEANGDGAYTGATDAAASAQLCDSQPIKVSLNLQSTRQKTY